MRIRHLVPILLALAAAVTAILLVLPNPNARAPIADDGSINITATADGYGAWVPFTVTVRNLGDRNFSGRVLISRPALPLPSHFLTATGFGPPLASLSGGTPPDAAYEFGLNISPRHKRTLVFQAPPDFNEVRVFDLAGAFVVGTEIADQHSIAVGVLSDSLNIVAEIQPIRMGDYTVRVSRWDEGHPFPSRAVGLSGYTTVILVRFDSAQLSRSQQLALRDFVGLGGTLVLAGSGDLARTARALPMELTPFRASGESAIESLQPVAALGATTTDASAPVALGTLRPDASVFLDGLGGHPLGAEQVYGSGRVVELLYDPDARAATEPALATMGWAQGIERGLEKIPGDRPAGVTLMGTGRFPEALLPKPSDAPFPPIWLVGGLLLGYLLIVCPLNYFLVRRAGQPVLFWLTAPLLALLFSGVSYGLGQSFQAGIHERELQFVKLGPAGAYSVVGIHGVVFPARGDHRVSFGSGTLLAPLTAGFAGLTPACDSCPFPVTAHGIGVHEHVGGAATGEVVESGVVYGGVRAIASGDSGDGTLGIDAHLANAGGTITGTITNSGRSTIHLPALYAFFNGSYQAALLADKIDPGRALTVSAALVPISDSAAPIPAGVRLNLRTMVGLMSDEAGRRVLSRQGEVAVVGFVRPGQEPMLVDGASPGREALTAIAYPVRLEAVTGRLGDVASPRLAMAAVDTGGGRLLDVYDIDVPGAEGALVLRVNKQVYRDVEVFDWSSASWRQGPFRDATDSPLVAVIDLRPQELRGGIVRLRVHEAGLTWGSELAVRFAGEKP